MKKRIMSLVLALTLALGLCAGASAAEAASRSGVLGDGDELSWAIDSGVLSVTANQGWTGSVFAACYNGKGRLTEVKVLTPDGPSAPVSPQVTRAKLFWTGEGLAPKCEPIQTRLAPDKVITQGVKSWYDLTDLHSVNYYVAPHFAADCVYTLNGAEAELSAVQSAAAKRGAVTEFCLDDDGNISSVTCYDYTVRKVDGQVSLCYTAPDGNQVTEPVTEKLTGKVAAFSTKSELFINGVRCKATGLTVEGCGVEISEDAFRNWGFLDEGALLNTYDFYLDKSGSICWVEQLTQEYPLRGYVLTDAQVQAGDAGASETLRAELWLLSGDPRTVTVSQLDGQAVTDPHTALAQLSVPAFYGAQRMADGTYALTKTSGASLAIPAGTSISPAEDFTGGALPLRADNNTVFLVAYRRAGQPTAHYRYRGFRGLSLAHCTGGRAMAYEGRPGVAQYVYLEADDVSLPLPEGYVFIRDNNWLIDPELYEDDVYLTNIVDTDGTETQMRLPNRLKDAVVSNASMELGRFADNAYVGRFCAVTGMDLNGAVTGLEPVDANHVSAFGNGSITTSAGTWAYDKYTRCVYVDLGWIDNPHDAANRLGVREDRDLYRVNASATFDPYNFFDPADVSADPADKAPYRCVKAAVVSSPETPDLADYIYVVRELW